MKRIIIIASLAVAGLLAVGCSSPPNAQQQEQTVQQRELQVLLNAQPLPHFNWSQYRQTLIDAETIAADGTATTTFFFNMGVRDPIFSCPSLGMPVPNTAQLSNPQQIAPISGNWGGGATNLPQPDPFGIYTPSNSSGTYVICISAAGKPYLQYWEGFVQAVSAPAVWDYTTHAMRVTGAPSFAVKTKP